MSEKMEGKKFSRDGLARDDDGCNGAPSAKRHRGCGDGEGGHSSQVKR